MQPSVVRNLKYQVWFRWFSRARSQNRTVPQSAMARPLPQRLAHGQLQHLFLLPADPIEIPEILRV